MKTIIYSSIGGKSFPMDEDACKRLETYLDAFRKHTGDDNLSSEIMEEVEFRIADLFTESLDKCRKDVVNIAMVNDVIARLGMPDGSDMSDLGEESHYDARPTRRFYRDVDEKKLGGVCSGLAYYFDVDVVLFRIVFLAALIIGTIGFWIYVIIWIVAPVADTAVRRCEMRGIPTTPENLRKYI